MLNDVRVSNGKKAYKKCWESKAVMLKKLEVELDENEKNHELEQATNDNEEMSKTFTVADLARELGVCPKNARRVLRKMKDALPYTVEEGKWEFAVKHKVTITKIIKK